MSEIHHRLAAVSFPPPPPSLLSFDDDVDFGDFIFAPVSSSLKFQQQQRLQEDDGDDEWGDFVTRPAGSNHFETHGGAPPSPLHPGGQGNVSGSPDSSAANSATEGAKWQKPTGAIPLAVFGEEEPEEQETPVLLQQPPESSLPLPRRSAAVSSPSSGIRLNSSGNLTDLIKNLYIQAEPVVGGAVDRGQVDGGTFEGGCEELDENGWEFKDAFSTNGVLKEQELHTEKFGLEVKIEYNGNAEVESVDNGFGKLLGTGHLLGVNNYDWPPGHAYGKGNVGNEPFGDPFESHFATDNSFFDIHPEKTHEQNGDVHRSNLENDNKGDDEDSWDFQSAISESKFVNVPQQQGISEAMSEMVRDTAPHEYMAAGSILGNTVENLPLHSFSNLDEEIVGGSYTVQSEIKGFKYSSSNHSHINILDLYNKIEQPNDVHHAQAHNENGQTIDEVGDSDFNVTRLSFHKDLEIVVNQECEFEVGHHPPTEFSHDVSSSLFCLLKDGLLFLINQHLVSHEKFREFTHSVQETKGLEIDEDFEAANQKLLEVKFSESDIKDKFSSKEVCISQLLKAVQDSNGGAFEQQYHLTEKILLAEKNLGSAIKLLEHVSSIVDILTLASQEKQHAYVVAWSKIIEACVQELKLGATIWEELLHTNDNAQILALGQYFLALGEIYRVVEILVTSINYYKPWIVSNWSESIKLMSSLGLCSAAWDTHLVKALETISDASDEQLAGAAKLLLSSINVVRGLDLSSLQTDEGITCKLSLLPAAALQEMKVILLNGEYYFLKLANLWANRVSCNPPQFFLQNQSKAESLEKRFSH